MTYRPGTKLVDHPRAANFVRRLDEGPYAGKFIYWFHNNDKRWYNSGEGAGSRNPAYLLGGEEHNTPEGRIIHWGEPVAILYGIDDPPNPEKPLGISYPDFIWDGGLYVTETQKTVARVHRIPDDLLAEVFRQ
jgi:hypothetical protein